MSSFGWCFIGAGNIARMVADDCEGIRIVSVCARRFENAQKFALKYGATAYETAFEAMNAEGVDGVYVATQHPEHISAAKSALLAGKGVLCEKPMGVNAKQVADMINTAKSTDNYLAEAMWPRHNPIIKVVKGWIDAGEIGEVSYIHADFAEYVPVDEGRYLRDKSRAGGALLDMGVYPVAMALYIMGGEPERVLSASNLTDTDVDKSVSALLCFPGGRVASVFTSIEAHSTYILTIHGSRGVISVPGYWRAREATLTRLNGETLHISRDGCKGYGYQMRDVESQIKAGLKQCPEMPLKDSLALSKTMDALRKQAGVVYEWD